MELKKFYRVIWKNIDRVYDTIGLISVTMIIGFSLMIPQSI